GATSRFVRPARCSRQVRAGRNRGRARRSDHASVSSLRIEHPVLANRAVRTDVDGLNACLVTGALDLDRVATRRHDELHDWYRTHITSVDEDFAGRNRIDREIAMLRRRRRSRRWVGLTPVVTLRWGWLRGNAHRLDRSRYRR